MVTVGAAAPSIFIVDNQTKGGAILKNSDFSLVTAQIG